MTTADRIERERLAKRTRILDAARELFVTRGVEAVTLREIAQRIEYSTTAIYVHFKDKQDLIDQMCREDFTRFANALLATAAIAHPGERLAGLGRAYVEFALTMPRHYQLLFMTRAGSAAKRTTPLGEDEPGVAGYLLLLRTVEECVRVKLFRPELTDAPALAQTIWASVHGLVSLLIIMGDEPRFQWRSPEALVELSLGALMRGLLADPGGAPPRRSSRK
jgi:AcrR family transcriptional regulator